MRWIEASEDLLDETRSLNAVVEEAIAAVPAVHTVPPAVTRAQRAAGEGPFPAPVYLDEAEDRVIPGPAGDIPLRLFVPEHVEGAYLHLHGGGWTLGGPDQQDLLLQLLATRAEVAVVSVGYRLAPEHPFPAGPDDCEAAALWLVKQAGAELGTDRLVIGGESAGAHLSALTLLRLRDRHGAGESFRGANLVFGAFDLGMTPSQRRWGDRNLVLSTPIIEWFYECCTPGLSPEQRRDPEISPLWADLAGLPPALFTVSVLDPLIDDSLFMASRWQAAGGEADLVLFPESVHGFVAFPSGMASLALDAQVEFLQRVVATGRPSG